MSIAFIRYKYYNQKYDNRTKVTLDPMCNGVMVVNIGTTIAMVNDFPIHPGVAGVSNGEAFIVGGNLGEIYKDILDIKFPGGPAAGNSVMVSQKIYTTGVE